MVAKVNLTPACFFCIENHLFGSDILSYLEAGINHRSDNDMYEAKNASELHEQFVEVT